MFEDLNVEGEDGKKAKTDNKEQKLLRAEQQSLVELHL